MEQAFTLSVVTTESGQVRVTGREIQIDLDPADARALGDQLLIASIPEDAIDTLAPAMEYMPGVNTVDDLRRWIVETRIRGRRALDMLTEVGGVHALRIAILDSLDKPYALGPELAYAPRGLTGERRDRGSGLERLG